MIKKVVFVILCLLLFYCVIVRIEGDKMIDDNILEGGRHEGREPGYKDDIKSKNIVYFEYIDPEYYVKCELKEDILNVISRGGTSNKRDNTIFNLDYDTTNLDLLKKLQDLVEKYELNKNNGYSVHVDGLPAGLGGTLNITYDSMEKIYHYSNQSPIINDKTKIEIYELFHETAIENGYDFTTDKSNKIVYDDATEEYLQGTWSGTHFGDKIKAIFKGKHVKIYVNDKLTDDVDYIIYEGNIRTNILVKETKEITSEYDYKEFNGLSEIKKKNDIMLTAYFMKESYSTCELLKEKVDN